MTRKRILPPTYFLIALVLMAALHLLIPIRSLVAWPYRALGLLPVALGLWLSSWASNLFRKADTTVKPFEPSSRLVTHGPFRFSRHPMYLGMALVPLGLAVVFGTLTPWLPAVALFIVFDRFAVIEERGMESAFGQAYRAYRRRVRRWL